MAIETRRDRLLYQGIVPVLGAILGALAATWFQSSNLDQAQLGDIAALLKDPSMSAQQKIQALELYKEITDRPWAILRSVMTAVLFFSGSLSVAIGVRYMNKK